MARLELLCAAALVALALGVRAAPVVKADFPLNDGGLFVVMSDELRANGFRMPATTSYDLSEIPFAYPPLGLYIAAAVTAITGATAIDVARVLPLVEASAAVVAFYLLARTLLGSGLASIAALAAFAFAPASFLWFVMGGGLTRAVGLVFAILAVRELVLLFRVGGRGHLALAVVTTAATVLAHPLVTWFLAVSSVLAFLTLARTRRGVAQVVAVWCGAILVASPWWLAVLSAHGPAPFAAAFGARAVPATPVAFQRGVLSLGGGIEPFLPVLGIAAVIGSVASLPRRLFVPLWFAVGAFVDPRAGVAAAVPLALAAGAGTEWAVRRMPKRVATLAAAIGLGVLATGAAVATSALTPLDRDARAAIAWIGAETDATASVLVVSGAPAPSDSASEWLPALAARRTVATPQGHEWRAGEFARRLATHDEVQRCASVDCIERWSIDHDIAFDVILVIVHGDGACCEALASDLSADPRYRLPHAETRALVFQRFVR
jgi:hypothetical protein